MTKPSFTSTERDRVVEQLISKTAQLIVAQSLGMTPEEAASYGAFNETALSSLEKDKLFEDFINDCFHRPIKEDLEYE